MLADLADQSANVGRTLGPLGATGRAQHRPDEPTLPIEDDNGLEAILIVLCGAPHNKVYAERMIMRSNLGPTTAKN
jgi:hypothetical protein